MRCRLGLFAVELVCCCKVASAALRDAADSWCRPLRSDDHRLVAFHVCMLLVKGIR
jgi:hypothetical protein